MVADNLHGQEGGIGRGSTLFPGCLCLEACSPGSQGNGCYFRTEQGLVG